MFSPVGTPEYEAAPWWKKVISWMIGLACLAGVVSGAIWLGWTVFNWWTSESEPTEPEHYACSYKAQQAIKHNLAFPSTFDEHEMLTSSESRERAYTVRVGDRGWDIRTIMIFGSQNAFGVQSDYSVWYEGRVDNDGNCTGVILEDFVPYIR